MTKGGHSVPCQVYYRLQDILPAAEDIGMGYPSVLVNKQSDRVYLDVDMTREELLKYLHDQLRTANLP
ncbi:MAG: hypothetical protein WBM35_03625 [Candidatus Electrothrix sp.]